MSEPNREEFWANVKTIHQMKVQGEIIVEPEPKSLKSLSPLIPIQSDGNKNPLFLVGSGAPGALLEIAMYKPYIEAERPFYLIETQKFYDKIQDMAADCVKNMLNIQEMGTYLVVSKCAGASLALEIAQQLKLQDKEVFLAFWSISERPFDDVMALNFLLDKFSKSRKILEIFTFILNKLPYFKFGTQILYLITQLKMRFECYLSTKDNSRRAEKLIRNNFCLANVRYRPTFYPGTIHIFIDERKYKFNRRGVVQGWAAFASNGIKLHLIQNHQEVKRGKRETVNKILMEFRIFSKNCCL